MTPLSQVLQLIETYNAAKAEYDQLAARLVGGDQSVEVDVLFTEGPYRTRMMLTSIVTEVQNTLQQIANALNSLGIDPAT